MGLGIVGKSKNKLGNGAAFAKSKGMFSIKIWNLKYKVWRGKNDLPEIDYLSECNDENITSFDFGW